MIYGYARVSTVTQKNDGNSLADQQSKLRENGAVVVYSDAFTGTKIDRPQFSKLLDQLKSGDTLMVTKLDRLSRSAGDGIKLVDGLLEKGVKVHILAMGVMDDTAMGRLLRNILFSFAEFERNMILERTQAGKQVARQREGYKEGRKRKQVDISMYKSKVDRGMMTVEQACQELHICRRTWYNRLGES